MKSSDHFLPVTGQWFASSLSMLVSRNAFERFRGVKVLKKRRLGVHQLLGLTKTLRVATQTAPIRSSQPGPAQPGVARNEASCRAAKHCRLQGRRALWSQEDIKWNTKAEDTKLTSPGDREWTPPLPLCMPECWLTWGDQVAVSLALHSDASTPSGTWLRLCLWDEQKKYWGARRDLSWRVKPKHSALIKQLEPVWAQHHLKQNWTYLQRDAGLPKPQRQSWKIGF